MAGGHGIFGAGGFLEGIPRRQDRTDPPLVLGTVAEKAAATSDVTRLVRTWPTSRSVTETPSHPGIPQPPICTDGG
jgi:hypothetical protein